MKTKIFKFTKIATSLIPAFALIVGIASAGEACYSFYYQPEVPESLNKYRR